MKDEKDKKSDDCMMKCPDCSHEMNVCRTRIRSAGDPVCPGCGATLVPITESDRKP